MGDFVSIQNARPGVYESVIKDIAQQNVCPFCPEHLEKFHVHPLDRRQHWWVTRNMYPYKPTRHHVLLIHIAHIDHMSGISPEAWAELGEIYQEQTKALGITGGSIAFRFGEKRFTGASVTHLHAHLIQSDPDDAAYDAKTGLLVRLG